MLEDSSFDSFSRSCCPFCSVRVCVCAWGRNVVAGGLELCRHMKTLQVLPFTKTTRACASCDVKLFFRVPAPLKQTRQGTEEERGFHSPSPESGMLSARRSLPRGSWFGRSTGPRTSLVLHRGRGRGWFGMSWRGTVWFTLNRPEAPRGRNQSAAEAGADV